MTRLRIAYVAYHVIGSGLATAWICHRLIRHEERIVELEETIPLLAAERAEAEMVLAWEGVA